MQGQTPAPLGQSRKLQGLPEPTSEPLPSQGLLAGDHLLGREPQLPAAAPMLQPVGQQGTPQQPYGPQHNEGAASGGMGLESSSLNWPPSLDPLPEVRLHSLLFGTLVLGDASLLMSHYKNM